MYVHIECLFVFIFASSECTKLHFPDFKASLRKLNRPQKPSVYSVALLCQSSSTVVELPIARKSHPGNQTTTRLSGYSGFLFMNL